MFTVLQGTSRRTPRQSPQELKCHSSQIAIKLLKRFRHRENHQPWHRGRKRARPDLPRAVPANLLGVKPRGASGEGGGEADAPAVKTSDALTTPQTSHATASHRDT